MAGLRDTEAQVAVKVSGISELERLNEATEKSVASLTKLDEMMSRGLGMSGGSSGGLNKINEATKMSAESASLFKENLDKAATASSSVAEKIQRSSSALHEQLGISERLSASSAKEIINAEKALQQKSKAVELANKAAISEEKLIQQESKTLEQANKKLITEEKLSQEKSKNSILSAKEALAQEQETASLEKKLVLTEKIKAQTNAINQASERSATIASGKSEGRIKSAAKESLALFAPGMLAASGVMKGAEYVQDLFKEGAKYNSEVSGMGGTWGTLVDGARGEGISEKEAGSVNEIVGGIQNTSRTTGRSIDLVNEGYQQMYHATESADRTKHLVHSEMMIADAMNMSDAQASRFAMYGVGHSLDRGYVTGGAMNQMVQYAPALNSALTRAYLAKTQGKSMTDVDEKDVEHTKGSLRDRIKEKEISAGMLEDALNYLGDDKFKHAAENAQKTIPGMVRSFENGLPRIVGKFESAFLGPLGKASSGFFEKATKWINGTDSDKWAESIGKTLSDITVKFTKFSFEVGSAVSKFWDKTSDFRSGFADGFVNELGNIKNAVGDAANFVGSAYQKIIKLFPKDSDKKAKDIGEITGKVAAFLLALKVGEKLPVIGKPFEKLLGYASELAVKLPIIGASLSKIIGGKNKTNAGDKMMTAADTMMMAANKMAGTNCVAGETGSSAGGLNKGRVVSSTGKFTLANRMANSKFGAGIDNMFLKGAGLASKGGIRGVIGKGIMATSSGLGRVSLGSANLLSKIGGTKLGGLALGAGRVGKSIFSRGGGALNAAFAGFDIYSAMKNNKSGTKKRHEGVGGAIGGGIGGTAGAALGSLLGPVGTVVGGMAGSWLGNKAGSFIGSNWNGITKGTSKAFNGFGSWMGKTGDKLMKGNSLFGIEAGASMKFISNPNKFLGDLFSKTNNKNNSNKSKNGIKSLSSFGLKAAGLPDFTKIKLPKLKLPKIDNPFKKWKIPKIKIPKFSKIKNPFSDWKIPSIKIPKIPKIENPFKNFKFPKIKFPKLPSWLSNLNPFGSAKSSAKGANKEAKNVSKSAGSAHKSISKTSSTAKKAGTDFTSAFKNAFNKAKSGASSFGNSVSKSSKNAFSKMSSGVKSGMNKAKSATTSGAKGIANAVKNGLKNVESSSKSAFNKLPSAVKSGINKAKSAASSGASGISKALSSGLKNVNSSAKSAMNGFASAVESGISKANKTASSGANKIVSSISSGLSKVGSVYSSAFNKLSSSMTSSMAKVATATTTGMSVVTSTINSGANKALSTMTNAFNKMASAGTSSTSKVDSSISNIGTSATNATSKVNALAAAINGLKSKTVTITANIDGKGAKKLASGTLGALSSFSKIPAFAGGSGGAHKGGLALVNDGNGENYREAYMLPNGFIGLFPKKRNVIVDLPAGAHVLNGDDTKRKFGSALSRYAEGTNGAVEAINSRKTSSANNGNSNSAAKSKSEQKVTIGKIEINISDASGNAKDMSDEIARQVEKKLEDVLRKFNSNYSALGA